MNNLTLRAKVAKTIFVIVIKDYNRKSKKIRKDTSLCLFYLFKTSKTSLISELISTFLHSQVIVSHIKSR